MDRLRLGTVIRFVVLIAIIAFVVEPHGQSAKAQGQGGGRFPSAAFGSPILLEGSGCVLVPFGEGRSFVPAKMTVGPAFFLNDAVSGRVGSPTVLAPPLSLGSCFDSGPVHWNNIMVYHSDNHDSVLLLNRKAVITHLYIPRPEPDHLPKYLVFSIVESNSDGVVDDSANGPVTLYVSDPQAHQLEAVTPPDTRVTGVTFDSSGSTLYVQIATDPDGNHKFDNSSPITFLRVEPEHPVLGAPMWNDDLQQEAAHLVAP